METTFWLTWTRCERWSRRQLRITSGVSCPGKGTLFILLLLFLSSQNGVRPEIESIYKTVCSHQKMSISCPDTHKIAIKRLYYGVKQDRRCNNRTLIRNHQLPECCRASTNDCIVLEGSQYSMFNIHCSGYRSCDVRITAVKSSSFCSKIGPKTHYQRVVYHCVPKSNIAEFCNRESRRGKSVFLANRKYPESIRGGNHECQCVVETGFGGGISLHAIDIMITHSDYGGRPCQQSLDIEDSNGTKTSISCGAQDLYGFRSIYEKFVHNVSLTMRSNSRDSHGFIWLQAKPIQKGDYVIIRCRGDRDEKVSIKNEYSVLPSSQKPVLTVHRSGESFSSTPTPAKDRELMQRETDDEEKKKEKRFINMAFIIGGAAAAFIIVFLIASITVILYCHCKRKKKKEESKSKSLYQPPSLCAKTDSGGGYDYNEDHYISIRRSPLKVSTYSNLQAITQKKIQEDLVMTDNPDPETDRNSTADDYVNYYQDADSCMTGDHQSNELSASDSDRRRAGILTNSGHYANVTFSTPPVGRNTPRTKNKTVSFSQPVAMVTPLHSASEESVDQTSGDPFYEDADDVSIAANLRAPKGPMSTIVDDCKQPQTVSIDTGHYKVPVSHPVYDTVPRDDNDDTLPVSTFPEETETNTYMQIGTPTEKTTNAVTTKVVSPTTAAGLERSRMLRCGVDPEIDTGHYKTPPNRRISATLGPPPPPPVEQQKQENDLNNTNVYCQMRLSSLEDTYCN